MKQYRKYFITHSDTLPMISQRELGDANRWVEIASLNSMEYPFISTTPSEGVKSPGDVILLPDSSHTNIIETVDLVSALGSDIYLDLGSEGTGEFNTDISGDLSIVQGEECLVQDLSHRLRTPIGTLPHHPDYGSMFSTLIGSKKDTNWREKCLVELSRVVRSDPRVTDISDIRIDSINQGISIQCTILYGSSNIPFNTII